MRFQSQCSRTRVAEFRVGLPVIFCSDLMIVKVVSGVTLKLFSTMVMYYGEGVAISDVVVALRIQEEQGCILVALILIGR